ncbi:hypothetical protein DPMN_100470 [Dreissena polymorpha]|uniref:Uncharacterized protein n=1 Tax=Dreissena polymorpha TaxID=45954 RepID=A0A9D4LG03_DREPO|nr:hypothetical protein DPMN_100470 [Dreissena polymorpha]
MCSLLSGWTTVYAFDKAVMPRKRLACNQQSSSLSSTLCKIQIERKDKVRTPKDVLIIIRMDNNMAKDHHNLQARLAYEEK